MKLLIAHHGGGKTKVTFVCLFLPVLGTKDVLFVTPGLIVSSAMMEDTPNLSPSIERKTDILIVHG